MMQTKRPPRRRWLSTLAFMGPLALTPALLPTDASAQASPYRLGISQTVLHDDNILLLGQGQALPAGMRRSDTVSSTALIVGVDQPISRQRVHGDATLRANRFARNKGYDNEGYNLRLGLDWETVARLGGSLSASRSRTLARFASAEDGVPIEGNNEQTTRLAAKVHYGLAGPLRAELALDRAKVSYSAERYRRREFEQDSASLGVRWRPSGAVNLLLSVRHTDGSYPNYLIDSEGHTRGDDFRRLALELSGEWIPSAASRLRARLGQGRTRYDVARERDYSGLTGELGWTWQPAGKLVLTSTLRHQPAQDAYLLDASGEAGSIEYSRMTTSLTVHAAYPLTAKVALQAEAAHGRRRLERSLVITEFGRDAQSTRDHDNTLSLGVSWQPQRSLSLGCDWRRFSRSGSDFFLAQRSNAFSCYGQFMLQ
ncbi:MAG TPA: hypothetical protein PKJ45_03915 [Rubrivivax sp.]|nr:hypothetical protein [Rubrivivax sp.]